MKKSDTIFPTAVIFAGGQSSRMKEDKALLSFGGYNSLSEYQYRRLEKIFHKVYISTKIDKFNFDAPCIFDKYTESSPLVALISLFESLESNEVFVLSVDAPFVAYKHIKKLYDAHALTPHNDATLLHSQNGLEPLCAIYSRSILPLAKKFLKEKNHRLQSLLSEAKVAEVEVYEKEVCFNLNHPFEYEEAIQYMKKIFS